ncbi:MAG: nucleotide sugar dehydrogenase [Candidatus Omnitrophica bacterium]|nr:nucleotide sugar dehydrogenase [Candidatus Omnitrophota bacterium]
MRRLKQKIKSKKAYVGIVGAGYVGLPLAMLFCKKGFNVRVIDIDKKRINELKKGRSYIEDVSSEELRRFLGKNFTATSDEKVLADCDVIIVCVPTPLSKTGEPDISFIRKSVRSIRKYLRKSQLIVLESTTYPGTSREVVLPALEKSGLKIDNDFYLAFSSERVDPLNKRFTLEKIPKVVGGVSLDSGAAASGLYKQIFKKVVTVSSSEAAEMSKLLENTFRSVNIGLINQINKICHKLDIDVWEVIEAASTKPFGFMAFYPGPGLGGHCLPTDPIFLSWKAKVAGYKAYNIIDLAHTINRSMPNYVASKIAAALKKAGKKIKNSRVLIMGVSYKKNIGDTRESPAINVIELLMKREANVSYYDPFVKSLKLKNSTLKSVRFNARQLKKYDCAVIITDHSNVRYDLLLKNCTLIIDTRNIIKNTGDNRNQNKVIKI